MDSAQENNTGLFGLRLSHSLHLGHLVGNVRPALADVSKKEIIVVLADVFTYTSNRGEDIKVENLLSMASEAMSLGLHSNNVKFAIQSEAFNQTLSLFTLISCLLKIDRLKNTKPIDRILLNSKAQFSDLTFPIIQCTEMVSTNSETLYSNIDNLGIVSLTEDLFRKLQKYTNTKLPVPKLKCGIFKNVRGLDYKKMSQGAGNAIFLSDSPQVVKRKISSINTAYPTAENINLELVEHYFKIVGYSDNDIDDLRNKFNSGVMTPLRIKDLLASEISHFFDDIQKEKTIILNDRQEIINRINQDTDYIREKTTKNIKTLFESFYQEDFFNLFKL